MKMKAWSLEEIGRIELIEKDIPQINDDEVLVQVKACGVCGSDISRIFKDGAHVMPIVLGHEFSGKVVEIGKDVESRWREKRVGVFPLIPCKKCECCKSGYYEMCSDYSYIGSRRDGAFAEYVNVPAWNLVELPENVSYEQGAMLEPLAVANHAISKINMNKDEHIAIIGLGTIGMLIMILLNAQGFNNILLLGNKKMQLDRITELGIDPLKYCDTKTENASDFINRMTHGRGIDVGFECVGTSEAFETIMDNAAPGAKIVVVGNPQNDMAISKETYWKLLRLQLNVIGTWNSAFRSNKGDDWALVLNMLNNKAISLDRLIEKVGIEKLENTIMDLKGKNGKNIKSMLEM